MKDHVYYPVELLRFLGNLSADKRYIPWEILFDYEINRL